MEHALEYITFYVKKQIAPLGVSSGLPPVRDGLLGVSLFVRFAYFVHITWVMPQ